MEKQSISKISWVLVGSKPNSEKALEQEDLQKMLSEAFQEKKTYQLFLCGALVDKFGTLDEMEEGFSIIKTEMPEYQYGDYGIISSHEIGDLLFMPVELTEDEIREINAQNIRGNTDNLSE